MILPSKELLSSVLGVVVESVNGRTNSDIKYIVSMGGYKFINIYELQHKMKEWAYIKGIMLQSYPYNNKGRCDALKGLDIDESFKADTEFEAVVIAAEYILKDKR